MITARNGDPMAEQQDAPIPAYSEPLTGESVSDNAPSAETMGLLAQMAKRGRQQAAEPAATETATEEQGAAEVDGEPAAEVVEATEEESDAGEQPAAEADSGPDPAFAAFLERAKAAEDELKGKRDAVADEIARADKFKERLSLWQTDRTGVLRDIIKEAIGADDDEAIDAELRDAYEELTYKILGVESEDNKASREVAKVRQELARIQREQAAAKEEAAKKAAAAKQAETRRATVSNLGRLISEKAEELPFLAAQESPGDVLYDVACYLHEHGEDITIQQAASYANDQLKKRAMQFFEKHRSLLLGTDTDQTKQSPPQKAEPRKTQPGPATLTNRQASSAAPIPNTDPDDGYIADPEEAEAAVLAKIRKLRENQSG